LHGLERYEVAGTGDGRNIDRRINNNDDGDEHDDDNHLGRSVDIVRLHFMHLV
jgi:hypothetical protein